MTLSCSCEEAPGSYYSDDCDYLRAAYIFAGLSMMLNIRLAYSSAPYALIRFKLPENLFSVFVRRMASALELWCLPSMLLGNIIDTGTKILVTFDNNTYQKESGSRSLNNNKDPNAKYLKLQSIIYPSIFTMWSDFFTYLVLLIVYITGGSHGHVTGYYGVIAVSGFVFGINMTLLYAADYRYLYLYIMGENSFPALTSIIHYITTMIFGNRRKWNSDFIVVCIDIGVAILISLTTAILWTVSYLVTHGGASGNEIWHIMTTDPITDKPHWGPMVSPALMVIVGMGLVYAIYPGIAPGMIVPFYLIDKIEMILLIGTIFPPVIVAILIKHAPAYSPQAKHYGQFKGWKPDANTNATFYHAFDLLIIIKITLAIIFIYSLHYRDSNLSRAIVNQPKMSTALTITFYMCHEFLLALGFQGVVGNNGASTVMLPVQYVGALFMIFLAFYSEGYIIEYKSHDPAHWPTEGMTKWNAFCYWCKRASKITNHNLRSLFTTDLRRDLLLCIQKNELI